MSVLPVGGPAAQPARPLRRVIIVTGMSGAGKSTALKALEDAGYETVDNLPLALLANLAKPEDPDSPHVAVGVDTRTRGFGVVPFLAALDRLLDSGDLDVRLVFVDCEDEILRRRYTETRRRHPLAADRPVGDGIVHERALVEPLRGRADLLIDSSNLVANDLRRLVQNHFGLGASGLMLSVMSFAFRYGLPREADLVLDVRFLANPYYVPELRRLSGRDAAVASYIAGDPVFAPFLGDLTRMLVGLLPRYEREGKSYLTIAIGCTGGQHRSVLVAERLAEALQQDGRRLNLVHRDLERALTAVAR